MKCLNQWVLMGALALGTNLTATKVLAQQERPNRPNFEEMRTRMMDRIREQMDVKDDAEWKLISERVTKVMDARRDVGFGGPGPGMFGRGRGPGGQGGDQGGGEARRRGGLGGEPSPEAEALQKAIDSKASADDIKAKLEKYRQSRKDKQAKLEKARADLKEVLSQRQEAVAVMNGLLE
jgi:hypothetical protein